MNRFLSRLSTTATARRLYIKEADRFIKYTRGDFSRENILAYIGALQTSDYAPSTIVRVMVPTARRVVKANGQEWPLLRGEVPELKEGDIYNPALEKKLVAKLIKVARTSAVSRVHRAVLALSTTYGFRRIEIAAFQPADINLEAKLLFAHTAKGGRERWHVIPDQILPWLDFTWPQLSLWQVSRAFWAIEAAAGVRHLQDAGWHAIRRTLVRSLAEARLPDMTIDNFMRWKCGGSDMKRLYYNSIVIGENSSHVEMGRVDRDVDLAVFEVHPFLKLWG